MTTFYSSHQHYPAPLDQPTPQSPASYMTRDHVGATKLAMSDSQGSIGSSPIMDSTFSSRRPHSSGANTIPTPTSAAGTVTAHDMDGAMDDESRDWMRNSGKRRGSMSAEEQHDFHRNHDRGTGVKRSRSFEGNDEVVMADIPPPMHVPTLQEILEQTDVHPLHLLCQRTYKPLFPRPTTSIFPIYNLTSIAESVARQDPVTGAKKKLRKSYKGKIMDLPGKPEIPKAVPRPVEGDLGLEGAAPPPKNRNMGLLEMLEWPEEEWRAQKVIGKDLHAPLPQDALRRALTMATGPIPGFDPSSLGLDDNKKVSSTGTLSVPRATQTPSASIATPAQQYHGATPRGDVSSASVSPAVLNDRSHRTRKKKRRYDDNSFEGYGDGYEDDEVEEGGGGGEGERRKKKKKKVRD
ncbi:Rox3-domain-containing protein [Terfezia boudieri ATCC MYA-4762]|uniref:Mediator of RNA polymerase II transcription subunit 19 n=1 Tax=Terfezia boudieri ATCC MYA-4762 TaxID=1051890 RepID=A0A3N4M205_9PEZI|nr:Rox3-domain-containing protein [Terfezia boudieri ATCC MYA-4762]